jgi:hypothetical protein
MLLDDSSIGIDVGVKVFTYTSENKPINPTKI